MSKITLGDHDHLEVVMATHRDITFWLTQHIDAQNEWVVRTRYLNPELVIQFCAARCGNDLQKFKDFIKVLQRQPAAVNLIVTDTLAVRCLEACGASPELTSFAKEDGFLGAVVARLCAEKQKYEQETHPWEVFIRFQKPTEEYAVDLVSQLPLVYNAFFVDELIIKANNPEYMDTYATFICQHGCPVPKKMALLKALWKPKSQVPSLSKNIEFVLAGLTPQDIDTIAELAINDWFDGLGTFGILEISDHIIPACSGALKLQLHQKLLSSLTPSLKPHAGFRPIDLVSRVAKYKLVFPEAEVLELIKNSEFETLQVIGQHNVLESAATENVIALLRKKITQRRELDALASFKVSFSDTLKTELVDLIFKQYKSDAKSGAPDQHLKQARARFLISMIDKDVDQEKLSCLVEYEPLSSSIEILQKIPLNETNEKLFFLNLGRNLGNTHSNKNIPSQVKDLIKIFGEGDGPANAHLLDLFQVLVTWEKKQRSGDILKLALKSIPVPIVPQMFVFTFEKCVEEKYDPPSLDFLINSVMGSADFTIETKKQTKEQCQFSKTIPDRYKSTIAEKLAKKEKEIEAAKETPTFSQVLSEAREMSTADELAEILTQMSPEAIDELLDSTIAKIKDSNPACEAFCGTIDILTSVLKEMTEEQQKKTYEAALLGLPNADMCKFLLALVEMVPNVIPKDYFRVVQTIVLKFLAAEDSPVIEEAASEEQIRTYFEDRELDFDSRGAALDCIELLIPNSSPQDLQKIIEVLSETRVMPWESSEHSDRIFKVWKTVYQMMKPEDVPSRAFQLLIDCEAEQGMRFLHDCDARVHPELQQAMVDAHLGQVPGSDTFDFDAPLKGEKKEAADGQQQAEQRDQEEEEYVEPFNVDGFKMKDVGALLDPELRQVYFQKMLKLAEAKKTQISCLSHVTAVSPKNLQRRIISLCLSEGSPDEFATCYEGLRDLKHETAVTNTLWTLMTTSQLPNEVLDLVFHFYNQLIGLMQIAFLEDSLSTEGYTADTFSKLKIPPPIHGKIIHHAALKTYSYSEFLENQPLYPLIEGALAFPGDDVAHPDRYLMLQKHIVAKLKATDPILVASLEEDGNTVCFKIYSKENTTKCRTVFIPVVDGTRWNNFVSFVRGNQRESRRPTNLFSRTIK